MGLLDKLSDPYMMMQIMGGLGLLTSKKQPQADKYREYMTQGLLGYSKSQKEQKQKADKLAAIKTYQETGDPSVLLGVDGLESAGATLIGNQNAFGGNSVTNQSMSKLTEYQTKLEKGLPISPELENAAKMAYLQLTNDKYITTAAGDTIRTPGMNMGGMFNFPWAKTTPLVEGVQSTSPPLDVVASKAPTGQNKIDETFAKDYVAWTTGGFSDYQKNMEQLYSALSSIESGDVSTGPLMGLADEYLPSKLVSLFDSDFVQVKEDIEEVVQRNLREVLGAQFTEKEGERLISRAFNPSLKPEQNATRIRRLLNQMERAAKAKQEASMYFKENNSLNGFSGKTYGLSDFQNLFDEDDDYEARKKRLGIK